MKKFNSKTEEFVYFLDEFVSDNSDSETIYNSKQLKLFINCYPSIFCELLDCEGILDKVDFFINNVCEISDCIDSETLNWEKFDELLYDYNSNSFCTSQHYQLS